MSLSGLIFPPLEKGRLDLGLGRQCFYEDQILGLGIGSIVIFIALFFDNQNHQSSLFVMYLGVRLKLSNIHPPHASDIR